MTPEEYINSLTVDEMRYVLLRFWTWFGNEGCPWSDDKEYDCGADENEFGERECAFEPCEQTGCWLKYYVWLYRKKKEAGKNDRQGN